MERVPKKRLELYSGRSHPALAADIARHLGVELGNPNLKEFSNGEIHCRYGESIRGTDVFIVQTHCGPVNTSIMEQCIMIDAAKRGSAKRITAVCPYYGYSRQDRKAEGREPITARLVADMLATAGADRIMSVDLHSGQIQGFFDGPVDHLLGMPLIEEYLRDNAPSDLIVVAPDAGRIKVAERLAQHLDGDLASVYKRRAKGNVQALGVMGDVAGRPCLLIDDMIDTGGSITKASELLFECGATDVVVAATHGIFSPPATDRLKNSRIAEVLVTNTLPIRAEQEFDKLTVLSIAPLLGKAIKEVFEDGSVTSLFAGRS
jgi:ribose-phosphate pyrophosphokinase